MPIALVAADIMPMKDSSAYGNIKFSYRTATSQGDEVSMSASLAAADAYAHERFIGLWEHQIQPQGGKLRKATKFPRQPRLWPRMLISMKDFLLASPLLSRRQPADFVNILKRLLRRLQSGF